MKNKSRTEKIGNAVFIIFITVAVFAVPTYAWFSALWKSEKANPDFRTGNIEYPEMTMWTFLTRDEGSPESNGNWEEKTVTSTDNTAEIAEVTTSGGNFSFELSSLHLGTIDNLLTVKSDNITYLRVKVDTSRFGDNVTLSVVPNEDKTVSGANYAFELFDGSKSDFMEITDGVPYEKVNDALGDDQMLLYYVSISESELSPDDEDFEDLEFTEVEDPADGADFENASGGDYYYVYVKIVPNLSAFIGISKELYDVMPCILLYNIDLKISFENYVR